MDLSKYPNLGAILAGTIAGNFRDWPAVRPELQKLIAEVERLEAKVVELEREMENLGWPWG